MQGQTELTHSASHAATGEAASVRAPWYRRATMLVPLLLFATLLAVLAAGLTLGLASRDLKGEVTLVNVFASWCVSCREEHPVFMHLRNRGVIPIHGLNYKDKPDDAATWLAELGDPYTRTGADLDGRVAIDWGVYGVPETFLVDREGRIAYKHIGPVTPQLVREKLMPLIEALRR